jgi:histone H3/H4
MEGDMGSLPKAVVKRIMTEQGGGLRVSGPALERAVAAAEDYLARLARAAEESATQNKRKTLMDADIDAAKAKLA